MLVILDTNKDNIIKEIRTIPNSFLYNGINFSKQFLETTPIEKLNDLGFYKLVEEKVDLSIYKITGVIECYNEETNEYERSFKTEKITTDEEIKNKEFENYKTNLLSSIKKKYSNLINEYIKDYTQVERDSWERQLQEAKEYSKDNTIETPLIDKLSINRGIYKDVLVGKILEKANIFSVVSGELLGIQQKYEDLISNSTTIEELNSIKEEIFPNNI